MKNSSKKKRVMVFGVFDRLHEGHRSFLAQAKEYGDEVIVVVARDTTTLSLKGKIPYESEEMRHARLEEMEQVDAAALGDHQQGGYDVFFRHQPDILCLGYDQEGLFQDLKARMDSGIIKEVPIIRLKPHEPERYHTSLL
jgi:FAD synthetase